MLLLWLLFAPVLLARPAWAGVEEDTPVRGGKTVKECNEELGRNVAALEAAGESASAFFHRCWYHSEKGKPTPIVAKGGDGSPPGQPSAAGTTASRSSAPRSAGPGMRARRVAERGRRVARRTARYAARRPARATVRSRRDDGRDDDGVDVDAVAVAPAVVPPGADRLPGHVNLGVPIIGTVAVPILPGLEATVQSVVEHPVVPGLVTTSP